MFRFVPAIAFALWLALFPAATGNHGAQPDVKAVVLQVIDGDSLLVDIPDFPPVAGRRIGIRVAGCDTPELSDANPEVRRRAYQAKNLTARLVPPGSQVTLRNIRRDKYFRLLCEVETPQGDLTTLLIESGLALPYNGGKKPLHMADAPPDPGVSTRAFPAHLPH